MIPWRSGRGNGNGSSTGYGPCAAFGIFVAGLPAKVVSCRNAKIDAQCFGHDGHLFSQAIGEAFAAEGGAVIVDHVNELAQSRDHRFQAWPPLSKVDQELDQLLAAQVFGESRQAQMERELVGHLLVHENGHDIVERR